jgi:hypothetical protein
LYWCCWQPYFARSKQFNRLLADQYEEDARIGMIIALVASTALDALGFLFGADFWLYRSPGESLS